MKFLQIFFDDFNWSLTCFLLHLKFFQFIVDILVFLIAFIFEEKHIFIDEIVELIIKFSDHGSHFLIYFIDLNLTQSVKFVFFERKGFRYNVSVSVGEKFWLIFLWNSAGFYAFFTIWAYRLSGSASFEGFSDWTRLNFVDIFIAF